MFAEAGAGLVSGHRIQELVERGDIIARGYRAVCTADNKSVSAERARYAHCVLQNGLPFFFVHSSYKLVAVAISADSVAFALRAQCDV